MSEDIDFSDIPEIESIPSSAQLGKFYRPKKEQITIRLDKDILAWFRSRQGKYQRHINDALREYVRRKSSSG